jgi:hypothetical protein
VDDVFPNTARIGTWRSKITWPGRFSQTKWNNFILPEIHYVCHLHTSKGWNCSWGQLSASRQERFFHDEIIAFCLRKAPIIRYCKNHFKIDSPKVVNNNLAYLLSAKG